MGGLESKSRGVGAQEEEPPSAIRPSRIMGKPDLLVLPDIPPIRPPVPADDGEVIDLIKILFALSKRVA